jgi:hypothetical protein
MERVETSRVSNSSNKVNLLESKQINFETCKLINDEIIDWLEWNKIHVSLLF